MPANIAVVIGTRDFRQAFKSLSGMKGQAEGALRMTLNETIRKVAGKRSGFAVDEIAEKYALKKAQITKTFKRPKLATKSDLNSNLTMVGPSIPVYKFGLPSPSMNKGWKRPTYTIEIIKGQRIPAIGRSGDKGFSASVYGANGSPNPRPRTKADFNLYSKLAKGLGGHPGHLGIFARMGSPKSFPIDEVFGPGAPQMLNAKRTKERIRRNTQIYFFKRLDHIITKVLDGTIKV